ncbi:succinylglutamate desuccinylase/aspartoacylase family protein [Elioraea sp.]|uniref:succinylglutamate desuccinylase/aspartoacylase domain-containing protein n=1 Tax=Elioraea sp. TaxID=2185103 RepID=UPI0025C3484B|nr:succinylglutamate desuccinylase/aspartoacylase family protein [Elioraea sp.]
MNGGTVFCDIDLAARGRSIGAFRLVHSDDRHAFGHVPVPVGVLAGGEGPTVLLAAGNHGDEYEGQAILLDLLHRLDPASLRGRIIILPALNRPAVAASARVSPLDGGNLNRAFLGGLPAGPTRAVATIVEALLPSCALAADLHSGGSTAIYADAALATRTDDRALFAANLAAARVTGLPLIQILGGTSTGHSLNSAAAAASVPMVAMELGGGGRADRQSLARGRAAVMNLLVHAGVLDGPRGPGAPQRIVAVAGPRAAVVVPADGVLEPMVSPCDSVAPGDAVAVLHHWREPARPPVTLRAVVGGAVLAVAARGRVEPGDHAALIAEDVEEDL